jgi:hypothetical protein
LRIQPIRSPPLAVIPIRNEALRQTFQHLLVFIQIKIHAPNCSATLCAHYQHIDRSL